MSATNDQIAQARDLFAPLGMITHRKMMGGATFCADGTIFAIIDSDGTLFLKAAGAFADRMADSGAQKFTMTRKDGTISTKGYWVLPDPALDDPDVACDWAQHALGAQE
jgi:DNA transformation protein